jgi:hypothetical protein
MACAHLNFPVDSAQNARHMHCSFSMAVGCKLIRQEQLQGCISLQGELEVAAMAKDDRDILEVLKEELDFIEKGGYGRSVRTPWKAKSVFQDSLTCINYGYPYRAHPCNECHLLEFVDPEHKYEAIPCHHIPLDETGATVKNLETEGGEAKLERKVGDWLRVRIREIEEQRATQAIA